VTDHVVLNRVPQYALKWLGVRGQIEAVCDYVLSKIPGAFTYDASSIPDIFPPCDEKRSLTCDEVIKTQMQWVPDGIVRVDETQDPPKFYFTSRYGNTAFASVPTLQLERVTLAIGTGTKGERVQIVSENIKPLYKLQLKQVVFTYEQTNKIGNFESLVHIVDTYPPVAASPFNVLEQTVNLLGAQGSDQQAVMESKNLSVFSSDFKLATKRACALISNFSCST